MGTFDDVINKIYDGFLRQEIRRAKDRRDLASCASIIAQDRYHGGSLGARAALAIMLRDGVEAALAFADDLEYHEG